MNRLIILLFAFFSLSFSVRADSISPIPANTDWVIETNAVAYVWPDMPYRLSFLSGLTAELTADPATIFTSPELLFCPTGCVIYMLSTYAKNTPIPTAGTLYMTWVAPDPDDGTMIFGMTNAAQLAAEGIIPQSGTTEETPEPTTLLLMGTGLIGMVTMYRKRRSLRVRADV